MYILCLLLLERYIGCSVIDDPSFIASWFVATDGFDDGSLFKLLPSLSFSHSLFFSSLIVNNPM